MHRLIFITVVLGATACNDPSPLALPSLEEQPPDFLVDIESGVDVIETAGLLPTPPPPLKAWGSISLEPFGAQSLEALRFVAVSFDLEGAGAPSVATIELISPNGAAYEAHAQPLTGSAYDPTSLTVHLPLMGTMAQAHELAGSWQARLRVDGVLAATESFELTP